MRCGSRGEKEAFIHLGLVPPRDEMGLISESVQRAPWGQQLEERSPQQQGRGVRFDSSCLSPLDTAGFRTPSAGPGSALGRKSAVIAIQTVGTEAGATITSEEHTARFLFVLMCLRKDATPPLVRNKAAVKFSQSNTILQKLERKTYRSGVAAQLYSPTPSEGPRGWLLHKKTALFC